MLVKGATERRQAIIWTDDDFCQFGPYIRKKKVKFESKF